MERSFGRLETILTGSTIHLQRGFLGLQANCPSVEIYGNECPELEAYRQRLNTRNSDFTQCTVGHSEVWCYRYIADQLMEWYTLKLNDTPLHCTFKGDHDCRQWKGFAVTALKSQAHIYLRLGPRNSWIRAAAVLEYLLDVIR